MRVIEREPGDRQRLDERIRAEKKAKQRDRLRMVAWRNKRAVYWLHNTLLQTLSEQQMLAIAESTRTL